mmetsp:Transcript_62487/g.103004  ORF Transcript_62487/g.103004 Transcript_62487/m.103004 type:complete len:211 (-) Transcript_62487:276-908(-)
MLKERMGPSSDGLSLLSSCGSVMPSCGGTLLLMATPVLPHGSNRSGSANVMDSGPSSSDTSIWIGFAGSCADVRLPNWSCNSTVIMDGCPTHAYAMGSSMNVLEALGLCGSINNVNGPPSSSWSPRDIRRVYVLAFSAMYLMRYAASCPFTAGCTCMFGSSQLMAKVASFPASSVIKLLNRSRLYRVMAPSTPAVPRNCSLLLKQCSTVT